MLEAAERMTIIDMSNDWELELPVYSLYVHPYDLYMLGNPMSDKSTKGQLTINNIKYDIYTKFRGHYTKNLPKRSYFIQLINPRRFSASREFHLNAEFNDPSFIRNKLSLDLFQSFGILAPTSKHIQLFLNDKYAGVYLQLESVDDLFLRKRGLPPGSIFYAVNNNANFSIISPSTKMEKKSLIQGYERKVGTYYEETLLKEFINKINNTPDNEFEMEISKYLNVDKYLRWLAVAVCTQNLDGFYHNYALYRNSETGMFEIMPWDYDATFGRDWDGDIVEHDALPIEGKNTLTKKLLEVPEFRIRYLDLLKELLDTLFTPAYLEPIITSLTNSIRPYLEYREPKQLEQFDGEKDLMITFIKKRGLYLRNHMNSLNLD